MEREKPPATVCPDAPDRNQCSNDDWWKQALDEAEVDLFGLVDDSGGDKNNSSTSEKSLPCSVNINAGDEPSSLPSVLDDNVLLVPSVELASRETSDQLSPGLPSVQSGNAIHSEDKNAELPRVHSGSSDHSGDGDFAAADDSEEAEGSLDADLLLQLPIPPSFVPLLDEGERVCESGPGSEIGNEEDKAFQEKEEADTDFDEDASALETLTHVTERFDIAAQFSAHSDQFGVDEEHTPDLSEPQSPWSVKFPPEHISDSVPDHTLPDAYIEQASMLITKAIQLESQEDYHEAFDLFKAGVDLLLNGVQSM